LFMRVGTGFLPEADEGGFVIDYLSPAGSALEETNTILQGVEQILQQTPDIAAFTRRTGSELGLFATQQNKGDVLVRLKPRGERRPAEEIISDLRDKLKEAAPRLDIEFVQLLQDMLGDLEGAPTPIEVKVFGDDPERLAEVAERVEPILTSVSGVVDVVGVERGNPEVEWRVDPTAAGRAGMTVEQVAAQLSAAWLGDTPTALRLLDRSIPVRVRYPDSERLNPWRLATLSIRAPDGSLVPLQNLAQPHESDGQSEWTRENL